MTQSSMYATPSAMPALAEVSTFSERSVQGIRSRFSLTVARGALHRRPDPGATQLVASKRPVRQMMSCLFDWRQP